VVKKKPQRHKEHKDIRPVGKRIPTQNLMIYPEISGEKAITI